MEGRVFPPPRKGMNDGIQVEYFLIEILLNSDLCSRWNGKLPRSILVIEKDRKKDSLRPVSQYLTN